MKKESINENIKWELQFEEIMQYYSQRFYCPNCGHHDTLYIRKGVQKIGLFVACPNCDCSTSL